MSYYKDYRKSDYKIPFNKLSKDLVEFLKENAFLAGGAIVDIKRGKKPKDYDIFFKSKDAVNTFITLYSKDMTKSPLGNYEYGMFQFITINYGSPQTVCDRFDWNVNQSYLDFSTNETWKHSSFDEVLLKFNPKCSKPLSAIMRLPYMLEKGFAISQQEHLSALVQFSMVGRIDSFEKVKDQLECMSAGDSVKDWIIKEAVQEAMKNTKLAKVLN